MYVLVLITKKKLFEALDVIVRTPYMSGDTSSFWIWENVFKDPSSTVHDCLLTWNFSATSEQIPLHTFTPRFDVHFFAKNEVLTRLKFHLIIKQNAWENVRKSRKSSEPIMVRGKQIAVWLCSSHKNTFLEFLKIEISIFWSILYSYTWAEYTSCNL